MTLTELKAAVLREIGVIATGEEPSYDDAATVAAKYDELYEMLVDENLANWASSEDIPAFASRPVTWMVAFLCCSEFGVPPTKLAEMTQKGALNLQVPSLGERILRRQMARDYVAAPAQSEYF